MYWLRLGRYRIRGIENGCMMNCELLKNSFDMSGQFG